MRVTAYCRDGTVVDFFYFKFKIKIYSTPPNFTVNALAEPR